MAVIGFIGLGNMGAPMAANLVAAGHLVRGFDLDAGARAQLAAQGGIDCSRLAEVAAGALFVLTMLPAGRHVQDVVCGPDGVLACAATGAVLIDCSTIDVGTARAVHDDAQSRGFSMLDAPVSGGVAGATAGTLTFMVGGSDAAFEQARPILEAMGKTIVHAGSAGAGQAAKLCNNLVLGISMVAVAEAFALAQKLGLSDQALFDVSARSSGQCWSLTTYCPVPGPVPSAPSNRDYQPGFAAALMLKDLTLATEAASASGAPSVLGGHARDVYARLAAEGLGAKDFSVIAEVLRRPPPL